MDTNVAEVSDYAKNKIALAVGATLEDTDDNDFSCGDAEAQVELGIALQQAGNIEEAVTWYRRAIKLKPDWAEIHATLGVALQALGQFDDAIEQYREAIVLKPDCAEAYSNLGVLLQNLGQSAEAVESLQRAVKVKPRFAEAHANLGVVLRATGKVKEAAEAFRRAITLKPNYAEAHVNLGVCQQMLGQLQAAATSLRVATILKRDYAEAYATLGMVMCLLGKSADAAEASRTAISLGIETVEVYLNMGAALQDQGRQEDALAAYYRAIDINPNSADAYSNLGVVLLEQAQYEAAVAAFRKAVVLDPNHPHAYSNLSTAPHEQGDDDAAADAFEKAIKITPDYADVYSNFAMLRIHQRKFDDALTLLAKAAALNQDHRRDLGDKITVPLYRIKHDLEQVRLLMERNRLAPEFEAYLGLLQSLEGQLEKGNGTSRTLTLEGLEVAKISPSYNRLVHIPENCSPPKNCLNPNLDIEAIERGYLESKPEVVYIDEFLSTEALGAIRNFCHEATVWKKEYPNGYLGATLKDGFASPLILQIAEELRTSFPNIFEKHLLEQAWAFKYDSTMRGINVHADFAAVNVNFWITRNEACLSPDKGGLIIWDKESPKDWGFQKYNGDEAQIRRFLSESGAKSIRVPYKENRCVIFNSTLFHETDRFQFNDAYQDRRINVTMLYGKGLKMR